MFLVKVRVQEVRSLAALKELSRTEVFVDALAKSLKKPFVAAKNLFQAKLGMNPLFRNSIGINPQVYHKYNREHYRDIHGSVGYGFQDNIYETKAFTALIPVTVTIGSRTSERCNYAIGIGCVRDRVVARSTVDLVVPQSRIYLVVPRSPVQHCRQGEGNFLVARSLAFVRS